MASGTLRFHLAKDAICGRCFVMLLYQFNMKKGANGTQWHTCDHHFNCYLVFVGIGLNVSLTFVPPFESL